MDSQLKKLYPESKRKHQSKQTASKAPVTSFKRYNSWIDAHKFVVEEEEAAISSLARTKIRLLAQAGMLSSQDASAGDLLEDDTVGSASMEMSDEEDESLDGGESVSDEEGDDLKTEGANEAEESGSESEEGSDEELIDDQEEIDQAAAEDAYLRQLQDEAFESELRK